MNAPSNWGAVPLELRALPRWGCWRYEERDGTRTKVPYITRTGRRASATNVQHWTDFESAARAVEKSDSKYDGIGFVFVAGDGLVGIDLDDCVGADGVMAPWAREIVNDLGSYGELSPSGTGVKIFLRGSLEGRKRHRRGCVETYSSGRYFTVTGRHVPGTPNSIVENQAALDRVYERFLGCVRQRAERSGARISAATMGHSRSSLSDEEVLTRCRRGRNAAKFSRLWSGDPSAYAKEGNDGESEADLALCTYLARHAWPDAEQVDRLFRCSGLCRSKWTEREDYRTRTIDKALAAVGDRYEPRKLRLRPAPTSGALKSEEFPSAEQPGSDTSAVDLSGTIADSIVACAEMAGVECFRTPGSDPAAFARIPVESHHECWRIRSKRFSRWLTQQYFEFAGRAPNDAAVATAVDTFEARGLFKGHAHEVFLRLGSPCARELRTLYIDLGDPEWQAIEVTAGGWRVLRESPVRFRRTQSTGPLPIPERGGRIELLREFVNPSDDDAFRLMVGFALACFMPGGGYPILVLNGEAGSAKSTTARVLRRVTDPSPIPLRSKPRNEHELFIAASNSRLLAFDNLTSIDDNFSDSLCKLATGGGFGARKLYSDDDEVLINASAPVILTGIDEPTDRDDFASRNIRIVQPAIPKEARRSEREFWSRFAQVQGKVLGALLDGVSAALRNMDRVSRELGEAERMADFCAWVTAAERGLGWDPGLTVAAFRKQQEDSVQQALEANPLALVVMGLMRERDEWRGTATQLWNQGAGALGHARAAGMPVGWPKAPNKVLDALRRAAEGLRRQGISFEQMRESDHGRARKIVLRKDNPSEAVRTVRAVRGDERLASLETGETPQGSSTVSEAVQGPPSDGDCGNRRSPRATIPDEPDSSDGLARRPGVASPDVHPVTNALSDSSDGPNSTESLAAVLRDDEPAAVGNQCSSECAADPGKQKDVSSSGEAVEGLQRGVRARHGT